MKIFTAGQIYEADKFTIEKQQITSNELMERSAVQIFNWIHLRMQGAQVKIHLFCGIGNNGGDGIALARHLQEHGYNIGVYVVNYSEKRSQDFLVNLDRLKDRKIWPEFLNDDCSFPTIGKDDIIIDAIFGIGLNRAPADWVGKLMQYLNETGAFILAVDISSGLYTNAVPEDTGAVIKANHVLSFESAKLVFFLPQTGIYSNQWEVLPIGLDPEYLINTPTPYTLMDKNEILPWYIPREKFSHKGTYGHTLMIGGSYGKIGAVNLAARASLTVGSGLVTAYVPKCGYVPIQTSFPEAMVLTDAHEAYITAINFDIEPTVIGIGMGLGQEEQTKKTFATLMSKTKTPMVLDADALNILSADKKLRKKIPPQSILTPHPKELERLVGVWKDDFDKLEKTKQLSKELDSIILIKGAHTITVYEGHGYINTTGNPGLATAGSGDVLTGMITGLLAQGYEPLQAAIFGVYLHGRAADIAIETYGYQALTATVVLSYIKEAFLDLFHVPEQPQQEEEAASE